MNGQIQVGNGARPRWWADERKALLALLGAALLLRVVSALTEHCIEHDGARFTEVARYFSDGRWFEGLDLWPRMSPLYPLLILGFGSGALISIVMGTLSILPVYFLARGIWDRRIATLSAGVVAFVPDSIDYGSVVMGEATFCFFFFCAMFFAWRGAERAAWYDFLLAGLSGGLAALTRPEGIYVLAATAGWAALRAITLKGWGRRALGVAITIVAFAITVFPYARWIHDHTNPPRWDISDSPFSQELKFQLGLSRVGNTTPDPFEGQVTKPLTYEEDRDKDRFGGLGGTLVHWAKQFVRLAGYALFPFLPIGLFRLRRQTGDWFVPLVGLGYSLPPLLMIYFALPFSHRYVLPAALFLAPIIALGLVAAAEWMKRLVPERRRFLAAGVALTILAAGFTVKGVKPGGAKRRNLVEAGLWIKANSGPRPMMATMDRRVEHYAEGYAVLASPVAATLKAQVAATKSQWVVVVPDGLWRMQHDWMAGLESIADLAHTVPASKERGDEVRIYRVK
jgi:hypothetical protein